jgi:hypothetical protein
LIKKKLPGQDFLSLVCLFSAPEGYQFQQTHKHIFWLGAFVLAGQSTRKVLPPDIYTICSLKRKGSFMSLLKHFLLSEECPDYYI